LIVVYIFFHDEIELVIGCVDIAQVAFEFVQYVAPKYQREEKFLLEIE
jgi:hypothetical protein